MNPVSDVARMALEFVRRLRARWIVFAATNCIAVVGAIAISLLIGPRYTSTMTVAAVSNSQSLLGNLSGAAGLLSSGSISSLASSLLNPSSALDNYQDLLQSSVVADALMQKKGFTARLFAPAVDPLTGKWRNGLMRSTKAFGNSLFGIDASDAPTTEDVERKINQLVVISQSSTDPNTLTISCTFTEPTLCPDLLMAAHREAEARLNAIMLQNTKQTAEYIAASLPKVQVNEVREAMIQYLVASEKTLASTSLDQPIAAIILDPPIAATRPSFPRPFFILGLSLLAGIVCGSALVWWRGPIHPI